MVGVKEEDMGSAQEIQQPTNSCCWTAFAINKPKRKLPRYIQQLTACRSLSNDFESARDEDIDSFVLDIQKPGGIVAAKWHKSCNAHTFYTLKN